MSKVCIGYLIIIFLDIYEEAHTVPYVWLEKVFI